MSPSSAASSRTMCACAALADEYAMLFGPANTAFFEQMLTMSPPICWARRTGSAALAKANEPRGMIRYCKSQSSNVESPSEPARVMPALLTRRSTAEGQHRRVHRGGDGGLVGHVGHDPSRASGPPSSVATSPTFASSRSAMTTLAPRPRAPGRSRGRCRTPRRSRRRCGRRAAWDSVAVGASAPRGSSTPRRTCRPRRPGRRSRRPRPRA